MENQNKKNLYAAKYKEFFKKIMGVLYKVGAEFLEKNIEYCLIGGIAVFLYSPKRVSKDLDFLVKEEDINKVLKILYRLYPDSTKKEYHKLLNFYDGLAKKCEVVLEESIPTFDDLV